MSFPLSRKVLFGALALAFATAMPAYAQQKSVAITAIVEHPALDSVRDGVKEALAAAGYEDGKNLKWQYQSAQGNTGAAVEIGTVDDIYYRPKMPYTIGLLGAIPSEASDGKKLRQIKGATPSLINMKPGCPFCTRCPIVVQQCLSETPTLETLEYGGHMAACHRRNELDVNEVRSLFAPEVTA